MDPTEEPWHSQNQEGIFTLGFQPPLKQWVEKYNHHCLPKGFNNPVIGSTIILMVVEAQGLPTWKPMKINRFHVGKYTWKKVASQHGGLFRFPFTLSEPWREPTLLLPIRYWTSLLASSHVTLPMKQVLTDSYWGKRGGVPCKKARIPPLRKI